MKDWRVHHTRYHVQNLFIIVVLIVVPLLVLFAAPVAEAQGGGLQWCGSGNTCLNQWGGGPDVKSYGPNVANDAWVVEQDPWRCNKGVSTSTCPINGNPSGLPVVYIMDNNFSSPYYGDCIGDYGNSQTDARAGVSSSCDSGGANGGWGTVFLNVTGNGCPSGSSVFYNAHWSTNWSNSGAGGIYWASGSGNQVYLNTRSPLCLFSSQV